MKIFAEIGHMSVDSGLIGTGDEIYTTSVWDYRTSLKPENVSVIESFNKQKYDVVILNNEDTFLKVQDNKVPIIWKNAGDFGQWQLRPDILKRISFFVHINKEGIDRYGLSGNKKSRVIYIAVDSNIWSGCHYDLGKVVTVGNFMSKRPEKGNSFLMETLSRTKGVPIDLYGFDNSTYPHNKGYYRRDELIPRLKDYQIYFNPSPCLSSAAIEAMVMGMTLVTVPIQNARYVISAKDIAALAENELDAVRWIDTLRRDQRLCRQMGQAARQYLVPLHDPKVISGKWKNLIVEAIETF